MSQQVPPSASSEKFSFARLALPLAAVVALVVLVTLWLAGYFKPPEPTPPNGGDRTAAIEKSLDSLQESVKGLQEAIKSGKKNASREDADNLKKVSDGIREANAKLAERLKETEAKLTKAREAGEKEEIERLNKMKERDEKLRKDLEAQMADYARKVKEDIENNRQVSVDPPPSTLSPPPPAEGESPDKGPNAALMRAGIAALCLIKPPLCFLGVMLGVDMGLFNDTKHRDAYLGVVRSMASGKDVGPEELMALADAVARSKTPSQFARPLEKLEANLPEKLRPEAKKAFAEAWRKIDEEGRAEEPETVSAIRKAMEGGAKLDEVLKLLATKEEKPIFRSQNEKERTHVLCRTRDTWLAKYWDVAGGLKEIKVEN